MTYIMQKHTKGHGHPAQTDKHVSAQYFQLYNRSYVFNSKLYIVYIQYVQSYIHTIHSTFKKGHGHPAHGHGGRDGGRLREARSPPQRLYLSYYVILYYLYYIIFDMLC